MIEFSYKGISSLGKQVTGMVKSPSQEKALAFLEEKGIFVFSLTEEKSSLTASLAPPKMSHVTVENRIPVSRQVRWQGFGVRQDVFVAFLRQWASLAGAGIPLESSLSTLVKQYSEQYLGRVLRELNLKIGEGESLAEAMGRYPRIFPPLLLALIRTAEKGGILKDALERGADLFENRLKTERQFKSALTYPAFVGVIAFACISFLVGNTFPTFFKVFLDLKIELPLISKIVLGGVSFLSNPFIFFLFLTTIVVFIIWVKFSPSSKQILQQKDIIMLKIPVIGNIIRKLAAMNFCYIASELGKSGVPLVNVLSVVVSSEENSVIKEQLSRVMVKMVQGEFLSEVLDREEVYPHVVTHMLAAGEATGNLDVMLKTISRLFEQEFNSLMSQISSLIEPVLVIVMGFVMGVAILAIFLPLYQLIGKLGQ